jgi:hypothetical protein
VALSTSSTVPAERFYYRANIKFNSEQSSCNLDAKSLLKRSSKVVITSLIGHYARRKSITTVNKPEKFDFD